jgi:hypothetical protein
MTRTKNGWSDDTGRRRFGESKEDFRVRAERIKTLKAKKMLNPEELAELARLLDEKVTKA